MFGGLSGKKTCLIVFNTTFWHKNAKAYTQKTEKPPVREFPIYIYIYIYTYIYIYIYIHMCVYIRVCVSLILCNTNGTPPSEKHGSRHWYRCQRNKHSSREHNTSECVSFQCTKSGGWSVVSAVGLQGKGLHKRSAIFTDTGINTFSSHESCNDGHLARATAACKGCLKGGSAQCYVLRLAGRSARSLVGAGVPRDSQRYLGFRSHFSMICHERKR